MAPVTVFGTANFANAARVMACLEEVGVEYEVVQVDYMAKEHKGADHLASNSREQLRKYSKTGHGDADLLREGNPDETAMVDVWTEVEANAYFPAITPIFYECVVYPAIHGGASPDRKVVEEKLRKVLDVYGTHLSGSKWLYLARDFFSFADLNHFPFTFHLMTATPHVSVFEEYPNVKAWWERVMARPSLKKISPGVRESVGVLEFDRTCLEEQEVPQELEDQQVEPGVIEEVVLECLLHESSMFVKGCDVSWFLQAWRTPAIAEE